MIHKLSVLLRLPLSIIGILIPKDKKIWVFGAWFGEKYSDNSKYFYRYLNDKRNIRAIWIYKNKKLKNYFLSNKLEAYYYKSIRGIYFQLISSKVFISHSISSDLNPLAISLNTQRIQLWHGVPLKKIMYDNPQESKGWRKNKIYRLFTNNFYNFVVSPCVLFDEIFASAFDMSKDKILDCGYPRNDVFVRGQNESGNVRFKAIYMPTYRSSEQSKDLLFSDKCLFDFEKLDAVLTANLIELTIRVHPANLPPKHLLEELNKSVFVRLSTNDDIYEEINQYDCLITDYSSIIFDFAVTGRPIIFAAFDLDDYISEERALYYPYSSISDGVEAKNWDEVLDSLVLIKQKHTKTCYGKILHNICENVDFTEKTSFSEELYNKLIRLE